MNRPVDETRDTKAAATTVLDRVRPTVVVRRRVHDVPPVLSRPHADAGPRVLAGTGQAGPPRQATDDEESGPPSSVNVARALASLRGDELRRLEEIVSADDEPVVPVVPVRSIRVGSTIALADSASTMNVPKQELVTALVTRGFFSVTVKTVLPRETAQMAAGMYGWTVEAVADEVNTTSTKAKATKPKRKTPSEATTHAKSPRSAKPSAKAKAKAKARKNHTARRRG